MQESTSTKIGKSTTEERPSRAPAASRTVSILKALGRSRAPLSLSQIASHVDALPSSCLNILRELVEGDLVYRDETTKQYMLSLGTLQLAYRHLSQNRLTRAAQSELDRLHQERDVTAMVTQRSNETTSVCVAVSRLVSDASPRVFVGQSEYAYSSATGVIVAAYEGLGLEQLKTIHAAFPTHSAPDINEWIGAIEKAKIVGYASDTNHYLPERTFFAAPILADNRSMIGALSVACWTNTLQEEKMKTLADEIKATARRISTIAGSSF